MQLCLQGAIPWGGGRGEDRGELHLHPNTGQEPCHWPLQTYNYVYRSRFPGVVAEVKIEESCIYTLTPDRNPVIDIMPGTNNIVIAAGFSGNWLCMRLEGGAKIGERFAGEYS